MEKWWIIWGVLGSIGMQSQMVVSKVGSSVTTELKIKRVINKQEL